MTQKTFRTSLKRAFKSHMFMQDRDRHTINELLYVLENDSEFKDMNFNITISRLDNSGVCIPTLDVFINVNTRAIWFEDAEVEFEIEELGNEQYHCITIYEREGV